MLVNAEKLHSERLKKNNIVIIHKYVKKYKDNNKIKKEITWRSSDGKYDDEVHKAVLAEKDYQINGKTAYREKKFDDTTYTFISLKNNHEITCPNCGYHGNSEEFNDGCPYCLTDFSIDYTREEQKSYKANDFLVDHFRTIPLVIAIIFGLIFGYGNVFSESSGANIILRIVLTIGASLFMGYIFFILIYLIFSFISIPYLIYYAVTKPSKQFIFTKLKSRHIADVNANDFYNAVVHELNGYYYDDKNINYINLIDYDIIKYTDIKYKIENNHLYIETKLNVRKIFFKNNKFSKVKDSIHLQFIYGGNISNNNLSVLTCSNCGRNIMPHQRECEYCHTIQKFSKTWELSNIYRI